MTLRKGRFGMKLPILDASRNGMELFLAHSIIKPPDFDQVLSVKVIDHSFTMQKVPKGIEVTIPGKSNKANERVKEAQQVTVTYYEQFS
jgi:hypothetical protein